MRLICGDEERLIFKFLNGFFFLIWTNRAQSIYLVTVFPSSVHRFFFTHFTSILQKLSRLSYNSYLHLSLFCRGSRISVSCFGFIGHTTRISNKTSFSCKRLVVKKINLETIFPAFQNWNILHWTFKARRFNLQIICTGHSKPENLTSK